jgi:M6 family metalloprotease-like protein
LKRLFGKLVIIAGVLAIVAGAAFALPPSRQGPADPRTGRYRSTGAKAPRFPKELLRPRLSAQGGKYPYSPKALAAARAGVRPLAINPAPGTTVRPLVVLVYFSDKPADQTAHPPSAYAPLFFDNGVTALSVANYWKEVSYGNLSVRGTVADIVGWVQPGVNFDSAITYTTGATRITDNTTGVNLTNMRQLVTQIVNYLDATQPAGFFRPYADPVTGEVQSLVIVHAGTGQEDTGDPNDLYSHQASVGPVPVTNSTTAGGTAIQVKDYVTVPEILSFDPQTGANTPTLIAPGVIVHEMGHLLGLPDLYPVSGTEGQVGTFSGVGVFDLMGYGLWGDNLLSRPDVPAHLSAWSKSFLGWLNPSLVTSTANRSLPPVELSPRADKVFSNTAADPSQYFLVENRETSSSLGNWLFDKFLPGAGLLIWQIDEYVVNNYPGNVNDNAAFRGVYVKEADGAYHFASAILGLPPGDPVFYGLPADYFLLPNQVFDRTNPSAAVNSSPILDNGYTAHPFDFGQQILLFGFSRPDATNSVDYVLSLTGGAGGGPSWKTFNVASTTAAYATPMRSNDILSLAFDSGNNTWMGSREQGIFRFLGTDFSILNTLQGLPSGTTTGAPVARIQAMAFETATGSMWVGTDRGLYKMRNTGSGFVVVGTSTTGSLGLPGNRIPQGLDPGLNVVRSLAIRGGFESGGVAIDIKYAATPLGLLRVDDLNNDPATDDIVSVILAGDVTAVAVDTNGTQTAADDVVWVGFANGTFTRSLLPGEGGNTSNDPLREADFLSPRYTLSGAPGISSLSVDSLGILWIGTNGRGIQAFDLGETLNPPVPNLRDPYDFNRDGNRQTEAYLDFNTTADNNGVLGSNNVTGVGFEAAGLPLPVAWVSQRSDNLNPGGGSRFNANLPDDNTTTGQDERLTVFSPIPPLDVTTVYGRSSSVSAVAGDNAGNVWFATTQPAVSSFPFDQANGVTRFGNAGILSLDSTNYVNTSAVARVTLQDDGLNTSDTVVDTAVVRVTSASDVAGFFLTLSETGPATGVFTGTFGFTNGSTDPVAHLISVQSGNVVTVTYVDANPPGVRTATATWRSVFPFEDGLIIKPWCFITTAAYGSEMAREVVTFRAFRDRYLLGNPAGRAFVGLYYRTSPPLANVIARSVALRAGARFVLVPAAQLSSFAVTAGPAEKGIAVAVFLLFVAGLTIGGRGRHDAGGKPGRPGRNRHPG